MTASRTANITIHHFRLTAHTNCSELNLDDNDPMSLCYAIASFWLFNSNRYEMEERFGCNFKFIHPYYCMNGVPVTDAEGWFQMFSDIIGEENTKKFIRAVRETYPTGKTEARTVVMGVSVPINFPRSNLENSCDVVRETVYERTFKVRDILQVMQLPSSSRYICHAVCMLIVNGDAPLSKLAEWYHEQSAKRDCYRQPYYNCMDMFGSISQELTAQVLAQTKHEVNESTFSFIPNPNDYGYDQDSPEFWLMGDEYYDFVDRKVLLSNMMKKDPEAEIHIHLDVPLGFVQALAQFHGM